MRSLVSFCCLLACLAPLNAASASSYRHIHPIRHRIARQSALDLSPIAVQAFVLPAPTDSAQASFNKKMNLENGVLVKGTRWIEPPQVKSRDLFILDITQSLEGGFDSVNMYDKGIASWGVMQWSAHEGSLGQALIYIKRRLLATHRADLWHRLFAANGLDVDGEGLILYGKHAPDAASARLALRGTSRVGNYDPNLAVHWASVLARAGRQPEIEALEEEYASHIVDDVLDKRLTGLPYHEPGRVGLTAADLADNDPYAQALVFALWTNNPRHAFEYIEDAARAARSVSASDNPAYWAPGAFSNALLRLCLNSRFGNWQERAAMIEARAQAVRSAPAAILTPFEARYQTVLAERKERRFVEIASRRQVERRGVSEAMEISQVEQANAALAQIERRENRSGARQTSHREHPAVFAHAPARLLVPTDRSLITPLLSPSGRTASIPSQIAPP